MVLLVPLKPGLISYAVYWLSTHVYCIAAANFIKQI